MNLNYAVVINYIELLFDILYQVVFMLRDMLWHSLCHMICYGIFHNAESREKITAVHDEEMSELREFFEEKLLITEQSYNEELTMLREQHELELCKYCYYIFSTVKYIHMCTVYSSYIHFITCLLHSYIND